MSAPNAMNWLNKKKPTHSLVLLLVWRFFTSQVIKNYVVILGPLLDLYHKHFQYGWISPRDFGLLLFANWNDNTLTALKNYVKITFNTDFQLSWTISRTTWAADLIWVKKVIKTLQHVTPLVFSSMLVRQNWSVFQLR